MCLATCGGPLQTDRLEYSILGRNRCYNVEVQYMYIVYMKIRWSAHAATHTASLNRLEETLASVHRSQSACEALEVPGEYWHLVLLTTHRGTSLLFSWLASMLSGAASSTSDWPPSPLIVHFLQTLTCSSMVLREPGAQAGSLSRHLYYDSPSHSESWRSSCSLYVIIYTGSWVRG